MSNVTFQKISTLDEKKLLNAIKSIVIETKAHDKNAYNIVNWRWNFKKLPTKISHIYVAKSKNKVVGYYHIPTFKFLHDNKKLIIGNVQSVAILKEFRNKGVFQKLAEFAISDAQQYIDLLYTFPNDNSIHTFLKYSDFKFVNTLPVYILPINIHDILKSKKLNYGSKYISDIIKKISQWRSLQINTNEKIIKTKILSKENLKLFTNYNSQYESRLIRDKTFLKWKYIDTKKSQYFCISLKNNNNLEASVIIKFDRMFEHQCLVIMDYAYKNIISMKKLLSNIKNFQFIKKNKPSLIMLTGLSKDISIISKCGFFKVPEYFVPRKLNLLVKSCSKKLELDNINNKKLHITLSDWDVF